MLRIKKKYIRRSGIAILVVGLLTVLVVGVAMADSSVTIETDPMRIDDVYVDLDGDGVHEASEFLGTFPIYNGNEPIVFTWEAYPFAAGVNGSYRVYLRQDVTPFEDTPTYREIKVSHHWASNPNGTTFTMGAFGFDEKICTTCPTWFVVEAETYVQVWNAETETYEYEYTPVGGATSWRVAGLARPAMVGGATQTSDAFIIDLFRPAPGGDELVCVPPIIGYCESYCSSTNGVVSVSALASTISCFDACIMAHGGPSIYGYYRYDDETGACRCFLTEDICQGSLGSYCDCIAPRGD